MATAAVVNIKSGVIKNARATSKNLSVNLHLLDNGVEETDE